MSDTPPNSGKFKLPNFIRDEASSTDAFDGPHERVARAMATVIDADPTLKFVGLLGAWGSGKSTVLRLMENHTKKLDEEKKNKTYFFLYDAWLHQNDPPRRSFLEMLVAFLAKENLTTKEEWADELDRLNRQIEDTETTVTPTFTPAGRALLASALLIPLGLEFIKHDWLDVHVILRWVGLDATVFSIGLWMLFAPVIVSVFIYFYWRTTMNPFNGYFYYWKNWTKHSKSHEDDSILSVFMKKEVERSRHRVVRSPDPTTIEFQTIFRKIMRSVMDPARKIVFVVDNLDRLPEREAVVLWTTVRSFFLGVGSDTASAGVGLPTVILPIDPGAVERMFADNHEMDDAEILARSFINKTFDLTFRVSPPVASDWVSYLERQMKRVFGDDCPPDWMYATRRLYDRYVKEEQNGVVTPREINTLLNAIALLKIQWDEEIPCQTLVYFAIYRDDLEDDILTFIQQTVFQPIPPDANWRRNIAAMNFGVPPERANQVLLLQPLSAAIKEAKQEEFDRLCDFPGADAVLEQAIESGDASEPEFLSNAALLIQQHSAFPKGPWITSLWENLRAKLMVAPPWQNFSPSTAAGLAAMIGSAKGSEISAICETAANGLSQLDAKFSVAEALPKEWVLAAEAVSDAADASGYLLRKIIVPGSPKAFFGVIETAKSTSLTKLVPKGSGSDEMQELVSRLPIPALAPGLPALFELLIETKRPWPWKEVTVPAKTFIEAQPATDPGVISALTLFRLLRKTEATVNGYIEEFSNNQILLERLAQAHAANLFDAEALIIALLLTTNATPPGPDRGQAGLQIFSDLANSMKDRPEVFAGIEHLLEQSEGKKLLEKLVDVAQKNKALIPLSMRIIQERIDTDRLGNLNAEKIMEFITAYFVCLDAPHRSIFLRRLADQEVFWQALEARALEPFTYRLFGLLVTLQDDSGKRAREIFEKKLRSLKREDWDGVLDAGADPYKLVASLPTIESRRYDLGANLVTALQGSQGDTSNPSRPDEFVDRWFALANLVSEAARRTLFRNTRDQMLIATVVPARTVLIFNVGGDKFISEGDFAEESDKCVRHFLLDLISSDEGKAWLHLHAGAAKKWLENARPETRTSFAEQLVTMAEQETEAATGQTEKLALELGIKFPQPPIKEKESEQDKSEEEDSK